MKDLFQWDNVGSENDSDPDLLAQIIYGCAVAISVYLLLVSVLAMEYVR